MKCHYHKQRACPLSTLSFGVVALFITRLAVADGVPFSPGDIFAGTGNGTILHYDKKFTLQDTLVTTLGNEQTGMAFDKNLNLYAVNFQGGAISKFLSSGQLLSSKFVINDPNSNNESIVFDKEGNFYVGQAEGTRDILKRDANGAFLARYSGVADRGTDWIELSADQKTIYYTGDGKTVRRIDVKSGKQLPDFATLPGPNAYGLHFLPNGNLLVADGDRLVQLNKSGAVVKTYQPPGASAIYSLALGTGGTTFLTADNATGHIYRYNVATGAMLEDIATGAGEIAGLAVAGGFAAGVFGVEGRSVPSGPSAGVFGPLQPIRFTLVDQAALLSASASALPVALAQREHLLSVNRTVTSDVNARLFRLRARSEEAGAAGDAGRVGADADGRSSKESVFAPKSQRFELFAAGDFGFRDFDQIGSSAGFDFDSQSATAGAEFRATKEIAIGVAGSYVDSHASLTRDLGRSDTEGYAVSTYVSWFSHNFFADALYGFSSLDVDIARHTLLGSTARARPQSQNHTVNFNTGYNLKFGQLVTGPIASLEYVNGHLDAYTEHGGGNGAVHADRQNYESLISRLGWQFSLPIATRWGAFTPQVRASWDHQYLDSSDQVDVSLTRSPFTNVNGTHATAGDKFTASGRTSPPGRDYLALGGGILLNLSDSGQVILDYEVRLAQANNMEQFASIKVAWKY